jgi:hypothetical protein
MNIQHSISNIQQGIFNGEGKTKRISNIQHSITNIQHSISNNQQGIFNGEGKTKRISNIQHSISNNQGRTLPWAGTSVARVFIPWVKTQGYKDVAPMELFFRAEATRLQMTHDH